MNKNSNNQAKKAVISDDLMGGAMGDALGDHDEFMKYNGKRVELSIHSSMSVLDSVNTAGNYISEAVRDRQPSIAITDINSVQAFPSAYRDAERGGRIKLIYGCELHSEVGYPFYVLVKNKKGLKELYELVSKEYDDKISTFLIDKIKSENLIFGISIMSEPIQKIIENADDKAIESIVKNFDYVLLNPTEYFSWYTKGKINDKAKAIEITKRIIALCEKNNVLPVASDEAHFVYSENGECRKMLLDYKGVENCDAQPNLYFRTTDEMLTEFDYLGKEKAFEIVVTNSNIIADMTDDTFAPFDTDTEYPNEIKKLKKMTYDAAYKKYGKPLPDEIKARIEKEFDVIGKNSKSVMKLIISERIGANAKEKGYPIGNRGTAGASLVANLIGITNINPLRAHYFCESCKYIEFHSEENCGVDLSDKLCPKCGKKLIKDGYTLQEEEFMGYDPKHEVFIYFNLPPEILSESKDCLKEAAKSEVVDCGRIPRLPDKLLNEIIQGYAEKRKLKFGILTQSSYRTEFRWINYKVKRWNGGVFVLPKNKETTDYTPVLYSTAAQKEKITQFDFVFLDKMLLRMNLLPYNTLSILYKLENATGINANIIPLDDKETMQLIRRCDVDGIGEFEHKKAKELIKKIKPQKFDELIKILGLSHGTRILKDNGEALSDNRSAFLKLPAFCDDIMLTLMKFGVERKRAFMISRRVCDGNELNKDEHKELLDMNVPEWVLNLCNNVGYLVPKAHAADYTQIAFRMAYYKAHFRTEFEKIAEEYIEKDENDVDKRV